MLKDIIYLVIGYSGGLATYFVISYIYKYKILKEKVLSPLDTREYKIHPDNDVESPHFKGVK